MFVDVWFVSGISLLYFRSWLGLVDKIEDLIRLNKCVLINEATYD